MIRAADSLSSGLASKLDLFKHADTIDQIALEVATCLILRNGKVLVMGNGGSAADAQHFAAELVGRFRKDRRPLRAMALGDNPSIVTALANDYEYSAVFQRQIVCWAEKEDTVIGISTSGKSENVIAGLESARMIGATTIGLTGNFPDAMESLCDLLLACPSDVTSHIQEMHIVVLHAVCEIVDDYLVNGIKSPIMSPK